MHRKGPREVPDFSRHPTQKPGTPRSQPVGSKAPRGPASPPAAKPQATSSKSGRRGQ